MGTMFAFVLAVVGVGNGRRVAESTCATSPRSIRLTCVVVAPRDGGAQTTGRVGASERACDVGAGVGGRVGAAVGRNRLV